MFTLGRGQEGGGGVGNLLLSRENGFYSSTSNHYKQGSLIFVGLYIELKIFCMYFYCIHQT